ncbi:MAG: hypothetical protein KDA93_07170 [Planctomycetaceae bacterium]|nr:hypothetical protein [Planctomycetaceae bacterium]
MCGCASPGLGTPPPAYVANPLPVAANNDEILWERTVDVLHEFHFEIARENRFSRVIETEYRTGSGLLEPWHQDSVGLENRLESSLQSVRRKVLVRVLPSEQGLGYLVSVEAFQEKEDLPGVAANSPGGATFQESKPLQRDLNLVVGQSSPSGWIGMGRDVALEQSILQSLQLAYSR